MEFFINKNINIYADQLCIFSYIIIIILFVDFCTIIPLNVNIKYCMLSME